MKIREKSPAREYRVGRTHPIVIRDCGALELDPDEQVTFVTAKGAEYDVARKTWGFYATPSTNGRLPTFGLRTALVKNDEGRFYVMLVERGNEVEFERYLGDEANRVIAWLDDEPTLSKIEKALSTRTEV